MQERQRRFVDYYFALGTVVEAAIRAGYWERYARAGAFRLLENVGMKAYFEDRLEAMDSERVANIKEVMEYLTIRDAGRKLLEEDDCGGRLRRTAIQRGAGHD